MEHDLNENMGEPLPMEKELKHFFQLREIRSPLTADKADTISLEYKKN